MIRKSKKLFKILMAECLTVAITLTHTVTWEEKHLASG